jgi:site-specific DNA-cytosine methylase
LCSGAEAGYIRELCPKPTTKVSFRSDDVVWFYPNNTIERTDIDISGLKRRNLTVLECERLQTLPEDYTKCQNVPSAQRYKMIGNGWTVDVVAHIFKNIKY